MLAVTSTEAVNNSAVESDSSSITVSVGELRFGGLAVGGVRRTAAAGDSCPPLVDCRWVCNCYCC